MRVGWLVDEPTLNGGAEYTQAEFRAAAPEGVEIVDCPPGAIDPGCHRYVIQNCVQYSLEDLEQVKDGAIKYWHDVGPWLPEDVRGWLNKRTTPICCSPLQAEYMGFGYRTGNFQYMGDYGVKTEAVLIPPAINLANFEKAAVESNGSRSGAVCVGSWRNYGKAWHKAAEWAAGNGGIDFYGAGPFAPPDSRTVAYEGMPGLLARYKTFVFLPTVIEPFGRTIVEAWASGCEIVTNGLVGAAYWIEERPEALETAAEDFWSVVLA